MAVAKSKLKAVFAVEPETCAESADLHYVSDEMPGFTRKRQGKQFQYFDTCGKRITDLKQVERLNKIGVPPAYQDVWLCPDPMGHLQATGRDARGRKQYRYHADWQAIRGETKFGQMLAFGALLPSLRQRIEADLKLPGLPREKVLAAVVKLLDTTHIRVGNEQYAKDNDSYGLTTMKSEHVDVTGNKIHFEFKGKSGQDWEVDIKDKRLADIVRQCDSLPGQALFQYIGENDDIHHVTSGDVNAYLQDMTGFEITAKYFRTWAGTLHAAMTLQSFEPVDTMAAAKKNIVQAIKLVATHLGNTPTICRKSYIHPNILERYLDCKFHNCWQKQVDAAGLKPQDGLTCEEIALVKMLEENLVAA